MKRIFVYMMALFLTGCVTMPPIPAFKVAPGDRIGVLVDVDDGSMHTHIGTTIFNNFEKDYPYDWNLDTEVTRTLMNSMRVQGFEAMDLEKSGFKHADVAGLITAANEKWTVTKGKEDTYRKLLKQYNLKAVVVIKNVTVIAALECSGGPCSERYVKSSGLYTRSFFGFTRYHAVAAFK